MKLIVLLIPILFITACHTIRPEQDYPIPARKNSVENWRQKFKDVVLCNCVLKGMSDTGVTKKFFQNDQAFNNIIQIAMKERIDRIVEPVVIRIRADSVRSLTTVSEAGAGKHVFDTCLSFHRSKKLDSITTAEHRWWKRTNIDSILAVRDPSF